jgi:hypothetical protein
MNRRPNIRASRGTNSTAETSLVLPARCLAVFVDDTGHEALVAGHPVYGLGGCAALARDLDHVIRSPWREIRRMAKVLQARIADIARWTAFDSLAVIFESSERADQLIEEAFQGFALEEGGKPIPVECYFMRKEHGEPALEVADFVMHAVGRQARQNLKKRGDFVPDFCAVFHAVDRRLTSFMEVGSVVPDAAAGAAAC